MNQSERWIRIYEFLRRKSRPVSRNEIVEALLPEFDENDSPHLRRYVDRDITDLESALIVATDDDGQVTLDFRYITEGIRVVAYPELEIFLGEEVQIEEQSSSQKSNLQVVVESQLRIHTLSFVDGHFKIYMGRSNSTESKKFALSRLAKEPKSVFVLLNDLAVSSFKESQRIGHCVIEFKVGDKIAVSDQGSTNGASLLTPAVIKEFNTHLDSLIRQSQNIANQTLRAGAAKLPEFTQTILDSGKSKQLKVPFVVALSENTNLWIRRA